MLVEKGKKVACGTMNGTANKHLHTSLQSNVPIFILDSWQVVVKVAVASTATVESSGSAGPNYSKHVRLSNSVRVTQSSTIFLYLHSDVEGTRALSGDHSILLAAVAAVAAVAFMQRSKHSSILLH